MANQQKPNPQQPQDRPSRDQSLPERTPGAKPDPYRHPGDEPDVNPDVLAGQRQPKGGSKKQQGGPGASNPGGDKPRYGNTGGDRSGGEKAHE